MHVIEIRNGRLMEGLARETQYRGIRNGAIVSLIGAVDAFRISTMRQTDALDDVVTDYAVPAEMTGTGEIVEGVVHVHAVMAIEGDRSVGGHLHEATIETFFARVYVIPTETSLTSP